MEKQANKPTPAPHWKGGIIYRNTVQLSNAAIKSLLGESYKTKFQTMKTPVSQWNPANHLVFICCLGEW